MTRHREGCTPSSSAHSALTLERKEGNMVSATRNAQLKPAVRPELLKLTKRELLELYRAPRLELSFTRHRWRSGGRVVARQEAARELADYLVAVDFVPRRIMAATIARERLRACEALSEAIAPRGEN